MSERATGWWAWRRPMRWRQDLGKEGLAEASTVHAALFRLENSRSAWDRRTVVVVDEAAMLDSRDGRIAGSRASRRRQGDLGGR